MATLTMERKEPLASGHARVVTVDGVRFRLAVERHTAQATRKPWRKPPTWYTATITSLPDGGERFSGRVSAGAKEYDIFRAAGLIVVCDGCGAEVAVWHFDPVVNGCERCSSAVAMRREDLERERAEVAA